MLKHKKFLRPKAIIPAAGRGGRMDGTLENIPKPLLNVHGRPIIFFAVEEAIKSGCEEIIVIIKNDKDPVKNSLSNSKLAGRCTFVNQPEPLGIVDAIARASDYIGSSSYVITFLDQLLQSPVSPTEQLMSWYERLGNKNIIASLVQVPLEHQADFTSSPFYYSLPPNMLDPLPLTPERNIVKLSPDKDIKTIEWFFFGRVIFPSYSINYFSSTKRSKTDNFMAVYHSIAHHHLHFGVRLTGTAYDFGTSGGYNYATKKFEVL